MMSESKPNPINPFEAARARSNRCDIRVEWSVRDLQTLRPNWTKEQCECFLQRHAQKFAAGMVRLGLSVLTSMADDPRFIEEIIPPSGGSEDGKDGLQHPPAPDS